MSKGLKPITDIEFSSKNQKLNQTLNLDSPSKNYAYCFMGAVFLYIHRGESYDIVVVVVYFILSRLLYLAFSANLGLLCMPHPGMGSLV